MKAKKENRAKGTAVSEDVNRKERVETAMLTGVVAGVAIGAVAGPAGMIAGGVIGGVTGAVTGGALADDAERRHAHAHDLDRDIGVTGGDIGAASKDAPPARIGAFSAGSSGGGSSTPNPSEGPIQEVDD
jgi:hypothetical protein